MPSTQSLGLFALACLLLALTPGPNLLYLVSRTLCQGRRAGIVSLAGTSFGFVFHVVAAALGLSAIFLTVPILYDATARLFRIGVLTSVLNPKVAMFYLALFPQFIDATRGSVLLQGLMLGFLQIAINTVGDLCFVFAAGAITAWLARRPFWSALQRWVLGIVLAGIALRLAVDTRK